MVGITARTYDAKDEPMETEGLYKWHLQSYVKYGDADPT